MVLWVPIISALLCGRAVMMLWLAFVFFRLDFFPSFCLVAYTCCFFL
jgi:hypothetical protein